MTTKTNDANDEKKTHDEKFHQEEIQYKRKKSIRISENQGLLSICSQKENAS